MMERILKVLFRSDATVTVAIGLISQCLADTVKNPQSRKAYGLISVVEKLRDACDGFLSAVKSRDTQELS